MLRQQFTSGIRDAGEAGGTTAAIAVCLGLGAAVAGSVLMRHVGALSEPAWLAVPCALAAALALAGCLVRDAMRRQAEIVRDTVPVSAIHDLVTWHDRFGDVVRASQASQTMLGLAPRAAEGDRMLGRVHVSDRPAFLRALSEAAHGETPRPVAFRLHCGDEDLDGGRHVMWAEMRAQRLGPEADGGTGAVVIAFTRDVTAERHRGEEVDAARQEAERANEMKGRFLATVTHELRTPLNAIIGFSELLAADHPFVVTDERRREYADIIRSSGHHLLEIVNTLLDMSKIESGNFAFEPESFGFAELASTVCDLMQLKADEAGIQLDRRLAADLPAIEADRRACRQILINLVSNAVKFTPAGGRVAVSVSSLPGAVSVCVADSGIGIPEADLPRLGDPFFQSGDLHRRHHEGTGLGLSVVRGLVGLHGGELSIESGAGAGTTVVVTLPLARDMTPIRTAPVSVKTRSRPAVQTPERMSA